MIAAGSIAERAQPSLTGGGMVKLRPWEVADHQALTDAFADPEIQLWHFVRIDSQIEAEEWIAQTWAAWRSEAAATWAIVIGGRPEAVGRVSLYFHDLRNGGGEVSYWVAPQATGAGVATSALKAVTSWAFEELGMHRLEASHSTANPASCAVATNAGFEAEGTRVSALLHEDGWHDMHVHRSIAPT